MGIPHPLHKAIGDHLSNRLPPECTLLLDKACGGVGHLSLFTGPKKSYATKSCDVDMLILRKQKISVIMEIEETNLKPTQIYGKFFASAWSSYFIHPHFINPPTQHLDGPILFIQVLDRSKLKKEKTGKFKQFDSCEALIKALLPLKESPVSQYSLLTGELSRIEEMISSLLSYINEFHQSA